MKQADVGVALLSGFGDVNVSRDKSQPGAAPDAKKAAKPSTVMTIISQKDIDVSTCNLALHVCNLAGSNVGSLAGCGDAEAS